MVSRRDHDAEARSILGTRPDGVTVATYNMMIGVVTGMMALDATRKAEAADLRDRLNEIETRQAPKPRVRVKAGQE
jgi:hypothetical protein